MFGSFNKQQFESAFKAQNFPPMGYQKQQDARHRVEQRRRDRRAVAAMKRAMFEKEVA